MSGSGGGDLLSHTEDHATGYSEKVRSGCAESRVHSRVTRRFSFLLSPIGIVVGYVLSLFAVTAGLVASPFSSILMGLLFVLVAAFFIVAIPVIVMAYLFGTIAVCRAVFRLGRRCLLGSDEDADYQFPNEASLVQKDERLPVTDAGLWDRWIDGV